MRVLRPNGTVISERPAHVVESILPVAQEAPVYSDTRVRQFTLAGVAPNTIIDLSYTIEDFKPAVPGDFYATWYIGTGHVTRRSRFIAHLPASLTPRIQERNVHFAREVTESHGCRPTVWSTTHVPRPVQEPFAPDSNPLYPQISVAAPITWQAEHRGMVRHISRGRFKLTPALVQQLSTVVMGRRPSRTRCVRFIPVGGAGFPLRVALTGGWRLSAAPADVGVGDSLRRLQGQGDALHCPRAPTGGRGIGAPELDGRREPVHAVGVPARSHDRGRGTSGSYRGLSGSISVSRSDVRSHPLRVSSAAGAGGVRARGVSRWAGRRSDASRRSRHGESGNDPDHRRAERDGHILGAVRRGGDRESTVHAAERVRDVGR